METNAALIPPKNIVRPIPQSEFGDTATFMMYVSSHFDGGTEFTDKICDTLRERGWKHRNTHTTSDPYTEVWGAGGFVPTQAAKNLCQEFFGVDCTLSECAMFNAILGANLLSPLDCAFVFSPHPNERLVKVLGYYGIRTYFAREVSEMRNLKNFIERV